MSMLNPFTIKKYVALIINPLIVVIAFFCGIKFYNLWYALGFTLGGIILTTIIGNLLLKNPFTNMLEGNGLLALSMDSTGIIQPFNVFVKGEYIKGTIGGKVISTVFDRNSIFQFGTPITDKKTIFALQGVEEGAPGEEKVVEGLTIKINKQEYGKARFAFMHYPCLIWNNQLGCLVTKEQFSDMEKNALAEHLILYLNRKTDELSIILRDFGRYVVETLKPKSGLLGSKWFWIIMGIGLVILVALFAPAIINAIKGVSSGGNNPLAALTKPVTPSGG